MLEEAENNAAADKGRKSLVSIAYELDNLFNKIEKIAATITNQNKTSYLYFEEVVKEVKKAYVEDKLILISKQLTNDLKYAYSLVILDFLEQKLAEQPASQNQSSSDFKKGDQTQFTEEE
jgi:hypothetical protein